MINQSKRHGFTIVELLIVIVVIGLHAAITVVAFNSLQTRAKNTAQKDAVAKYVKLFMLYTQVNGTYPRRISQ